MLVDCPRNVKPDYATLLVVTMAGLGKIYEEHPDPQLTPGAYMREIRGESYLRMLAEDDDIDDVVPPLGAVLQRYEHYVQGESGRRFYGARALAMLQGLVGPVEVDR